MKRITHIAWYTLIGIFIFGIWTMPLIGTYELFSNPYYNENLILLAKTCLIFLIATYFYNTFMLIKTNDDFSNTRILILIGVLVLVMFFLGLGSNNPTYD